MFSRSWTPLNIFGANPRLHQARFQHLVFKPIFHSYEAPRTIVPNVWCLPYFFLGVFQCVSYENNGPQSLMDHHDPHDVRMKNPQTHPSSWLNSQGVYQLKPRNGSTLKLWLNPPYSYFFMGVLLNPLLYLKKNCADSLLLLIIMIPMKVGLNGHFKSILAIPIGHDPGMPRGHSPRRSKGLSHWPPWSPRSRRKGKVLSLPLHRSEGTEGELGIQEFWLKQ